jgi:hypothetical protein
MKLDPKEVWKKAAGRAAAAPGNLAGGAVAVAASAALWNPLPLILWGLGAAGWVLYASTSEGYTRRILDEERRAAEAESEAARAALQAQVGAVLGEPPFSVWIRAGLLPDYLATFARLSEVGERVNRLLQDRKEDYLAGLGIQKQLTYLLNAYLQFVRARINYVQILAGEVAEPGPAAAPGQAAQAQWAQGGGRSPADPTGAAPRRLGEGGPRRTVPVGPAAPIAGGPAASPGGRPAAPIVGGSASQVAGAPRRIVPITERVAHGAMGPREGTPVPIRGAPVPSGGMPSGGMSPGGGTPAGAPPMASGGGRGTAAGVPPLPAVEGRLAELDARIASLRELAQREPSTARTREWHIGILQKQQELLRDCQHRDQQVVAQLTAVPDVFEVILGRVSASQFSVTEVASYMGGVVEQIEETERFVQSMQPAMDEMLVHLDGGAVG